MRRAAAIAWTIFAVLLAGCTVPEDAPTDQALIEQLDADRVGFEHIVSLTGAAPAIERVERRRDRSWLVLSEGADARRVETVQAFMARHDISSVARTDRLAPERLAQVWFVRFEGKGAGKTYQSKTLIFGEPEDNWRFVADSDAEMKTPSTDAWRVVFRNAGGNWQIRTSCDC